MGIYDMLERECLPLMDSYTEDLTVHDKGWIEANSGVPFLHYTRHSGTNIVTLPLPDDGEFPKEGVVVPFFFGSADREHILDSKLAVVEWSGDPINPKHVCHYYNGKTLRRISIPEGEEVIREYMAMVRSEWRRLSNHGRFSLVKSY